MNMRRKTVDCFFAESLPIEEEVRIILNRLPESIRHTAILAGGALRSMYDGTETKDYDIFFRSLEDYQKAVAAVANMPGVVIQAMNPNYPSFELPDSPAPYNLIGFRFLEPVALAGSFDFLCCSMSAWLVGDELRIHRVTGAEIDASLKHLRINRVRPTKRILKRTARYVERYGYEITDQFVEKLRESFDAENDADEPEDY